MSEPAPDQSRQKQTNRAEDGRREVGGGGRSEGAWEGGGAWEEGGGGLGLRLPVKLSVFLDPCALCLFAVNSI